MHQDQEMNLETCYRSAPGRKAVPEIKAKLNRGGFFWLFFTCRAKIHKTPVKIRPVCLDCASTKHALGIWVDSMLQHTVKSMPAYFKDSFELIKILKTLNAQKGWSIFSFDAISMYTNIDTQDCISRL